MSPGSGGLALLLLRSLVSIVRSHGGGGRSSVGVSGDRSTRDSGSWSSRSRSMDLHTLGWRVPEDTERSGGGTETESEDTGEEKIRELEHRLTLLDRNNC